MARLRWGTALASLCALLLLGMARGGKSSCTYTILVAYSLDGGLGEKNFTATAAYLTGTAGAALLPSFPECSSITFTYRPFKPDPSDTDLLGLQDELLGPAHFLVTGARMNSCAQDFATTMLGMSFSQAGPKIQGSLITHRRTGIRSFTDLHNRSLAVVTSLGGVHFLLQAQRMAQLGLSVWNEPRRIEVVGYETAGLQKTISSILRTLMNGRMDAAFASTEVNVWPPGTDLENLVTVCNNEIRPLSQPQIGCTNDWFDAVIMGSLKTPET